MKFYYENNMGDYGVFEENDLIKAIYTAWNIEANLYLIKNKVRKIHFNSISETCKLIFAPWESNEFNSDLLKEFGYYMEDGDKYREIKDIKTGKVHRYKWSEVMDLV